MNKIDIFPAFMVFIVWPGRETKSKSTDKTIGSQTVMTAMKKLNRGL